MAEELIIETMDRRPDLADMLWQLDDAWPAFVLQDPMASLYFTRAPHDHPEHALVAYEASAPDVAVARAFSVPFAYGFGGRTALPGDGWDAVIRWAALDRAAGREPNLVSALEITIRPDRRGEGLAAVLLDAMRANVRRLGYEEFVAPVRPSGKPAEPDTPMSEYAHRTRADGLPADPWLRTHVRAGGEIVGVCPRAMVISGSLAEWRTWTGRPFDRTGDVVVPGGLVPVHCSAEHDHAVYVEPGVWVRHRLG
ncbi:N-acetyltransferase [Actinophytocola sp. NPDC049390]|uniref:N-acetyltransferase n=1 Tax=Actinophytocola sp. NPDC049390 TaxID=3363894 RepID=UPI00379B2012